jgi:hypothetical protein
MMTKMINTGIFIFGSALCAGALLMTATLVQADACKEKKATGEVKAADVKAQTECPVMGGKINKAIYADHDGKRIYLCCKGCIGAVQKDPAKYIKALEDKGVTVETVKVVEN